MDLATAVGKCVGQARCRDCIRCRLPEVCGAPRKPGAPILPFVLEPAKASRHMLPYGKKDRPILATASLVRAKEDCDLVPFDLPGNGLWCKSLQRTGITAQAAGCCTSFVAECSNSGSYREPSRRM